MNHYETASSGVYPGCYQPIHLVTDAFDEFNLLSPNNKLEPDMIIHNSEAMQEIWINLPGLQKYEISILLDNRILWVRAYHAEESEKKRYEAKIRIPTYADAWFIQAIYQAGLLKIKIPIEEQVCPKISRDIIIY